MPFNFEMTLYFRNSSMETLIWLDASGYQQNAACSCHRPWYSAEISSLYRKIRHFIDRFRRGPAWTTGKSKIGTVQMEL